MTARADVVLGAVAAGAFVCAASADAALNRPGPLLAVAAAVAAGAAVGVVVGAGRVLGGIGGGAGAVAVWLLGQRHDVGAAAILAFLFGAGVGVALERVRPSRTALAPAAVGVAVVVALRAVGSRPALAWIAAAAAVACAAVTVATRSRVHAPSSRAPARAVAFGTAFVAFTLLFTGYVGAETPNAAWFGGGAVHGPTDTGEVALTFDDGPNAGATLPIMHILDRYGVKAAFFQVGKAIDARPDITRALYADGQLVGNHSYHHDQWRWLDPSYPELKRTQAAFRRAIGTCPVLYRPPHGDRTPFLARVVRDEHMHMVLWNASTDDWTTDDANAVARRILDRVRPGSIVDLHDGLDGNPEANRSVVVRALPLILDGLRAKGLTAVRLDRLLGTRDYQPC